MLTILTYFLKLVKQEHHYFMPLGALACKFKFFYFG